MAKCPAHEDRLASLSITDMGNGNTRLHCFAGCKQQDVIDALGLKWTDLQPGAIDPAAFALAERMRSEQERNHRRDRRMVHMALERASIWNAVLERLARLWKAYPDDGELTRLMAQAIAYKARCERIADLYDFPCARGMGSAKLSRELTINDIDSEWAVKLGITKRSRA